MKKAKVILTAVGVLAIAGGALAFKATRSANTFYTSNAAGQCKVTTQLFYTTDPLAANTTITVPLTASTKTTNAACPIIPVYSAD
ncbi:hypothetical protein HGH93_21545 [Chitinophaga polysaccharea]|uniref:hypothetical protein n=1 Tax=Chitinophaga polysaccharea TaxID=1293035 RepID=UPI001455781F|nr:hypothetical protein [Chitinophaga polysaccharea]NLR60709.1 hypothetical protein [Chitinophaga polysaccharea]